MAGYTLYMHVNKINGKRYIGITTQDVYRRWRDGEGYKNTPYFYAAIKKYGWDNFEHIVIKTGMTKEEAENEERRLIKLYDTTNKKKGYNISNGGFTAGKHSLETRKKMSELAKQRPIDWAKISKMREINTGRKVKTETRIKISQKLTGKKLSPYHIKRISESHKGYVHTEEQKRKISQSMKRRLASEEARRRLSESAKKNKKIIEHLKRLSIQNIKTNEPVVLTNTGEVFENHLAAGKTYNIQPSKILDNCKGVSHSAGKDKKGKPLIWCFFKEYNSDFDYQEEYNKKISSIKSKISPTKRRVRCVTTGEVFDTIKDACEKYSISRNSMWKACTGQAKYTKLKNGALLEWEYVD